MSFLQGLFQPPIWLLAVYLVIMTQITIAGVTLYLHRDATHRGLDLHPAVRHFFRFWLWFTTGIVTKEWVAVHRKHHARCETPEDPHSPQVKGLWKVLTQGYELYAVEAVKPGTLEKYGRGTPDDWLERRVYTGASFVGVTLLLFLNFALFGVIGITVWALQMITIPFCAAGVINGVGHYSGYRNYECDDAARNIVPWGVVLGGEELHNNHHAFPSSAKFSMRRWEFDIGWAYIRTLQGLGLARVRRVAPQPAFEPERGKIDLETVRAVLVNRMHVLRDYGRSVTLPVLDTELSSSRSERWQAMVRRARKLLLRQPALLDDSARERLREVLDNSQALSTVHEFRERLRKLWTSANLSNDRLLKEFRDWCAQAEASGIQALEEFAARLSSYRMLPETARI